MILFSAYFIFTFSVYFRLPYTDTLSITYLIYYLYRHFKCTLYLFIPMLSLYLIFVFNDTLSKQETYLFRCSLYTSYFLVSTISFWIPVLDTSLIWYFYCTWCLFVPKLSVYLILTCTDSFRILHTYLYRYFQCISNISLPILSAFLVLTCTYFYRFF